MIIFPAAPKSHNILDLLLAHIYIAYENALSNLTPPCDPPTIYFTSYNITLIDLNKTKEIIGYDKQQEGYYGMGYDVFSLILVTVTR